MPRVTATGLESSVTPATTLNQVQWAIASGTVDAITAAFTPALTALSDGLVLAIRTSGPNITSTPSLNPDGLGTKTITRDYGVALEPGDIPVEAILRYKLSTDTLVLVNPNPQFRSVTEWAAAGGTVDAITVTYSPTHRVLKDGAVYSFRATGANTLTVPTLSIDTGTARIIKKLGAQPLAAGDIFGASHEVSVRYHDNATPWFELLNPATLTDTTGGAKFVKLDADATISADVATVLPWFPATPGVTLALGEYEFTGMLWLSRAAGAGSHTTTILFGGTAVLTNIVGFIDAKTGDAADLQPVNRIPFATGAGAVAKVASTSTTEQSLYLVRGSLLVGTAGTVIPQYQYSGAAGAGTTSKKGSFMSFVPKANPQGTWA